MQIKEGPISFTILANGALLADVPGYHTADFVYPVGYKVSLAPFSCCFCPSLLAPPRQDSCDWLRSLAQGLRTFPSMRKPTELGDFEFEIRYGGIFPQGGPLFCVRQVCSSFSPLLLLSWSNVVEPGGARKSFYKGQHRYICLSLENVSIIFVLVASNTTPVESLSKSIPLHP